MLRNLMLILVCAASPQALAEGDPEYGQYLSSECVTCHLGKATEGGIPSINGYDSDGFQQIMKLYRSKELENPTMQTIAGRLTDEDIAALAAYYSALPQPE